MILELKDITGESAILHVECPPKGTLGAIFDADKRLREIKPRVLAVTLDGAKIHNWETLSPAHNQRVVIIVNPAGALVPIIQIAFAILGVVQFITSLFASQPDNPKLSSATPTYTFEGLRNTYTPGGPVPVVYGEHEVGGQVLMYYVDVEDRRKEKFYQLIAVGEGEIESVEQIKINNIDSNAFGLGIGTDFRLGTGSQTIITGFETIRNTFFDGRPFSPDQKLTKAMVPVSLSPIIYPTVSNDVEGVDIDVMFPDGLGRPKASGGIKRVWADYEVKYSEQGLNAFVLHGTRRNTGKSRDSFIDRYHMDFPTAGAYDVKLTFTKGSKRFRPGIDLFRHVLQNVTEIRGPAEAYTGTALVAVQGVANANLQGGQPTISSVIRGKKVKIYDSVDSYHVAWTQNPAWCIYDYMTNSVYGMGPYITEADLHKQSFIDFATLANSQVEGCPQDEDPSPASGECGIFGTITWGEAPCFSTNGNNTHSFDTAAEITLSPATACYDILQSTAPGVAAPDAIDFTCTFRGLVSGTPIAGAAFLMSGADKDNVSCYAILTNWLTGVTGLYRFNNASTSDISNATLIYSASFVPNSGDLYWLVSRQDGIFTDITAKIFTIENFPFTPSWGTDETIAASNTAVVGFLAVGGQEGRVIFGHSDDISCHNEVAMHVLNDADTDT